MKSIRAIFAPMASCDRSPTMTQPELSEMPISYSACRITSHLSGGRGRSGMPGNNVDILAETKVFEDLLGENRRFPGCNGNADAGRL